MNPLLKLKFKQLLILAAFCFLANPGQSSEVKPAYHSKISDFQFVVTCGGWIKDAAVLRCDLKAIKVCPGQSQLSRFLGVGEVKVVEGYEYRVEKKMVVTCL